MVHKAAISFLTSEYRLSIPVGFWSLTLPRGLHRPTMPKMERVIAVRTR